VAMDRNTLVEDIEVVEMSNFGCDRKGALIESADILRETFRTSDIIARIGGDGFEGVSIETPREKFMVEAWTIGKNLTTNEKKTALFYKYTLEWCRHNVWQAF